MLLCLHRSFFKMTFPIIYLDFLNITCILLFILFNLLARDAYKFHCASLSIKELISIQFHHPNIGWVEKGVSYSEFFGLKCCCPGHDAVKPLPRGQQEEQSMVQVGGYFDNVVDSNQTASMWKVTDGWRRSPDDSLPSSPSFALISCPRLWEREVKARLRAEVSICEQQYGFMWTVLQMQY